MKIVLFSNKCPKCSVLEKKLNMKNITYEECNDIDFMQSKGISQVPMLEVDGALMDFSASNKWINKQ